MSRPKLLGRGIYSGVDVARLVRMHPEALARWTAGGEAVVPPSLGPAFDFGDLVSLLVISRLRHRGVRADEIKRGVGALAEALGVVRPLAHIDASRRLGTVGRSFFADVGGWADAGRGMQMAFASVIAPVLQPLEYDTSGMARVWRPVDGVSLSPDVHAGAPVVDGTRVPTSVLHGLVRLRGVPVESVAFDHHLPVEAVDVAVAFELALRAPLRAAA